MKKSEVTVLLAHNCELLVKHAQTGDANHRLEEVIEDLVKFISLRWPDEAGFLYSGFDEARERHRAEQRKKTISNIALLAGKRMMEPERG